MEQLFLDLGEVYKDLGSLVQNIPTPSKPFETNRELAERAKVSKDKIKKTDNDINKKKRSR